MKYPSIFPLPKRRLPGPRLGRLLPDLRLPFARPHAGVVPEIPLGYLGVWQRTFLDTTERCDTTSRVYWLQTRRWHADLRVPAERPDFSRVSRLAECSDAQLAWLAGQQGFVGITEVRGARCTWRRQADFQPGNGRRDSGHMAFNGERLVETGAEADYLEIWQRLPESPGGTAALELVSERGDPPARRTWLLVAGDYFMYVRARARPLPVAADLQALIAELRPAREQLLDWLDFEISFGHRSGPEPWRIALSSLPFREGQAAITPGAIQCLGYHVAIDHEAERRWMILDWNLDRL